MSTKCSIAHGEDFHLYNECWEDDCVYLELDGSPKFEVSPGSVMVRIPIQVWEYIRKHPGRDLTLAEKSEDEIRAMVEKEVDERIREWKESGKTKNKQFRGFLKMWGADKPRQAQVRQALRKRFEERVVQKRILAQVRRLEWEATDEGREAVREKWRAEHPREVRSAAAKLAWIRRQAKNKPARMPARPSR